MVRACTQRRVPLVACVVFCFDGDNVPDAYALAACVDALLPRLSARRDRGPAAGTAPDARWRPPASWAFAYGGALPQVLFE